MNVIRYFIQRYVGTLLITSVLVIIGIISFQSLPVSYYPQFSVPAAIIITAYPGASPEIVENDVTKPIEEAISTISGVDQITSTSREGFSQIIVNYAFGVSIDKKQREIQEKIDLIKGQLPRNASTPSITTINNILPPPVELSITSDTRDLAELKEFVEKRISPAIARLPGVANVKVTGGIDEIIRVEIDPIRLYETGIGLNQIAYALSAGNIDYPVGEVKSGQYLFSLRLKGNYQTIEDIKNEYITVAGGRSIRVGDIAKVYSIEKTQTRFARLNLKDAVGILVRKPSNGNSVQVARSVKKWLKENETKLPSDIKIQIIKDESNTILNAIRDVIISGLLGALLASLIILLFLGRFRNALVIIISIPITIIITFIFMKVFNLSLNTISIGGLSLATGLIVDASIVVMENIFRHLRDKDFHGTRLEMVVESTREVGLAISAGVITTIVVFLPLAFTQGFAKVLLGELALTVVFSLCISIIVAVTIVPIFSYFLLKPEQPRFQFNRWFLNLESKMKNIYTNLLNRVLQHRLITVLIFVILLIIGFVLASFVKTGLIGATDEGEFQIVLEYPRGTSLEYCNNEALKLEKSLLNLSGVSKVSSIIGEDPFFSTPQPYSATINVYTDRKRPVRAIIPLAKKLLESYIEPTVVLRIIDATVGIRREDIDINIFGANLDTLRELGDRLVAKLREEKNFLYVNSNLSRGLPAFVFIPNRMNLSAAGISAFTLAQILRIAKSGEVVTTYRKDDRDIDVELTILNADKLTLRDIGNLPIATPLAGVVPLKSLGVLQEGESPSEIVRINQRRSVNITGSFAPGTNSRVNRKILDGIIRNFKLPEGYNIEQRGANRAIAESFKTLGIALIIAIILVYMVLGVQFNSLTLPFVIILSVPFSITGFFAGLVLTGNELNLSSFLSAIILSGIVTDNAILLLDYVVSRREKNVERNKAIIEAGEKRFRPVMMTSLTTIFGSLFLALNIGGGGESLKALASAFIGGMTFSIFVSLILIPVVYTIIDDLLCRISKTCMPERIRE
ncbi:MAG: efflux RND transporter permease subunit [candidate division WOR-3 bacterium]|nr:efflux RND transporter permease subunit [candidate division WOR-3 bacterium]